jgi:hypothetical protein
LGLFFSAERRSWGSKRHKLGLFGAIDDSADRWVDPFDFAALRSGRLRRLALFGIPCPWFGVDFPWEESEFLWPFWPSWPAGAGPWIGDGSLVYFLVPVVIYMTNGEGLRWRKSGFFERFFGVSGQAWPRSTLS